VSLATDGLEAPDRTAARVLFRVLAASVASTVVHYTDNYVYFDEYPQPASLRRWQVYAAWILLTAVGALGYHLYRSGNRAPAYVCLVVYSYTGLSSLGHYLYGGWAEFSGKQHVFILLDGAAGLAVLAFVAWSAAVHRRRGGSTPSGRGTA
jgi:hypothetical protein